MVGRDVVLTVEKEKAQPTDVVLKVRNLEYTNEWNKKMLDKLSFDVRKGRNTWCCRCRRKRTERAC